MVNNTISSTLSNTKKVSNTAMPSSTYFISKNSTTCSMSRVTVDTFFKPYLLTAIEVEETDAVSSFLLLVLLLVSLPLLLLLALLLVLVTDISEFESVEREEDIDANSKDLVFIEGDDKD
jgi:hypothetical protein